jgi:hypothetical protein
MICVQLSSPDRKRICQGTFVSNRLKNWWTAYVFIEFLPAKIFFCRSNNLLYVLLPSFRLSLKLSGCDCTFKWSALSLFLCRRSCCPESTWLAIWRVSVIAIPSCYMLPTGRSVSVYPTKGSFCCPKAILFFFSSSALSSDYWASFALDMSMLYYKHSALRNT